MRTLLILAALATPLPLVTGCASDDDHVVNRQTKTKVTTDSDGDQKVSKTETTVTSDGDRKTTKTEKTTRVDD